ncbi:MAG TPA: hypothetical protein GXZ45_09440 [Propionibacterium sp.]|nr:hypothetical protein [Propionibacterium sp.]
MPVPTSIDPTTWVDGAPFAAHLVHLCSTTGLPWSLVAAYAGVPLRTAERLLAPSRRSRLRRLPRSVAQRLIAVTPEELRRLRTSRVPAESCSRRVGHLLGRGVPLAHLARELGCSPDLIARLADGSPATVTAEVALRARVACETADRASLQQALHAA